MSIDVLVGLPGNGKTYSATDEVIHFLKKGVPCYTNWKVATPDGKYVSLQWKKEYATKNIRNSRIYIDEAWKDYNSNNWKEMTKQEHQFFAESRHVGNHITVITQSTARIATLIKEIGEIIRVKKKTVLFFFIIGFVREYYDSLDSYNGRFFAKEEPYYKKDFLRFKKYVANSYNTHESSTDKEQEFVGEKWEVLGSKPAKNIIHFGYRGTTMRKIINKIDSFIDMEVENLCKNLRKKLKQCLRLLWKMLPQSRRLIRQIPRVIQRLSNVTLIKRFNDWRRC